MKFNKKIVASIVLLNAIFTMAFLVAFVKVKSEPSILIGAWFSFTTGELWMLASIKKKEIKKDE